MDTAALPPPISVKVLQSHVKSGKSERGRWFGRRAASWLCVGLSLSALALAPLAWPVAAHAQAPSRAAEASRAPAPRYPVLAPCGRISPPVLPERWRAVALMAPFEHSQLDVGEFVYDAALPAMRATVTGLQSGALDLLITEQQTYRIVGPRQSPTACMPLGRALPVPKRQWLSAQAQCAGKAPLMATPLEWWSTPGAGTSATWYWHRSDTRLPWRTMRLDPSNQPAVIGGYALATFTTFERLPRTQLAELLAFCRANAAPGESRAPASIVSVREMMTAQSDRLSAAERETIVANLVPGLSYRACANASPFLWPPRFQMSAVMLSTDFGLGPYPAEIYYDWAGENTMLTRLRNPNNPHGKVPLDALLKGGVGYHIIHGETGALQCEKAYPGIIRPDWMVHDRCQCRAVIRNNRSFGRNSAVQVMSCPVDPSSAFWAWYNLNGRPLTFQSTAVNTAGLALADYDRWEPMAKIAPEVLALPAGCSGNSSPFSMLSDFAHKAKFEPCSGCHMNGDNPR